MSWTQLVQPNVNISENAGWCLSYARRAFGAPVVEASAWSGWMMTEHPHADRNFPAGVAVPVWFDWTGDVGAGRFRYGHVAVRTADGKVWSSPLSGYGRAWFASVDDLTRAFGGGMRYVGWSEDISDVRVVKEDKVIQDNADQYFWYGQKLSTAVIGGEMTRAEFRKYIVGKTPQQAISFLFNHASAPKAQRWQDLGRRAEAEKWEQKLATSDAGAVDKLERIKAILG